MFNLIADITGVRVDFCRSETLRGEGLERGELRCDGGIVDNKTADIDHKEYDDDEADQLHESFSQYGGLGLFPFGEILLLGEVVFHVHFVVLVDDFNEVFDLFCVVLVPPKLSVGHDHEFRQFLFDVPHQSRAEKDHQNVVEDGADDHDDYEFELEIQGEVDFAVDAVELSVLFVVDEVAEL